MNRLKYLCISILCCVGTTSAIAQTQDVQQLQEKLQQLEQLTNELKARIATLEKSAENPPQQPPSGAATPQKSKVNSRKQVPAPQQQPPVTQQRPPIVENPAQLPSETDIPETAESKAEKPPSGEQEPRMDVYGFAMLDMGYDFGQNDPNWFDVMRPTKLPSSPDEFGRDGRFYTGVRQSRFGARAYLPTSLGEIKTIFEFELFGVGNQVGETTFRLRHAWGELGPVGAGQTWSPFMDPDVFPNSLEYWGPNGMVFFRNVQLRLMPINKGNHQLYVALERPGATADQGTLANRIELQNVVPRFPAPDLSARFRWGGERSHFQIGGIGRYIAWDDLKPAQFNLGGHTWGWGVNLSGNVPVAKKDTIKLSLTYGHGIENYMNDAPADVAPIVNRGNIRTPITGEPLPVLGVVAFYDRYWSERWSSTVGYSMLRIDNVVLQNPSEFHRGQYGLANLLFYPIKNVMTGGEFQWGRRENFRDGFVFNDYRIQFGFKYNFDYKLGGAK